ncbi:MAG: 5'/3'-nucleotidase SurE [Desulfovibrio sp.]|nr:MAG: 5'/3'-nucleotidase SurE [Desulfovibrio sp.]
MRILLSNDDGIQAVGLRALYTALKEAGHDVSVYAPVTEQSAVGHAVTIAMPLRVKEFKENSFEGRGVSGTPADCVKLALTTFMDPLPDLVVSGINAGANVGVDIIYSGTVGAATEAALMGVRGLAVSYDGFAPVNLIEQARHAVSLIDRIPWQDLPQRSVMNLNYPDLPMEQTKELKCCPHTRAMYEDWFEERHDPRGHPYYWLTGVIPGDKVSEGTDRDFLWKGHVTLTPLRFDFTNREALDILGKTLG